MTVPKVCALKIADGNGFVARCGRTAKRRDFASPALAGMTGWEPTVTCVACLGREVSA